MAVDRVAAATRRSDQTRSSARWQTIATTKSPALTNSTPFSPMEITVTSAMSGPASAPALPPAAIAPNRRFVWLGSNSSSRKLQNIDIKKRLTTLMKT